MPDARGSYSSVWHRLNEQENVGLVDGAAAEGEGPEHMVNGPLVSAEDVSGERLGQRLDLGEQGFKIGESQNGQNRTEDFIFHHFVRPRDGVQNGGIQVAGRFIEVAPGYDLAWINQGGESLNCVGTDYPGIVRIALGILAVEIDYGFLAFRHECVCHGLMDGGVTRRSAPLPAPRHRAPYNFLRCVWQVRCLVNDRWILAAQFQQNWSEAVGRCFHHSFSSAHTASEKNEIERKLQQFVDFFSAARNGR